MRRTTIWGAVAVVSYVAAAALSYSNGLLPVRPLYEGFAPPPAYRWVTPPIDLKDALGAPEGATGKFRLTATGSEAFNLNTTDTQATVIFPPKGVKPHGRDVEVEVRVEPLDPATIGSPPAGRAYDGNAYLVEAKYFPSGAPISLDATSCPPAGQVSNCATIALRYPFSAKELYRRDGDAWTKIEATIADSALQVFADTLKLGTFVAVHLTTDGARPKPKRTGDIIALAAGLSAILGGTLFARMRATRARKREEEQRRKREQRRGRR